MQINFPYPSYEKIAPFEVPDKNLMGVYSPRAFENVDEPAVLEKGFAEPIGAAWLRAAVKKGISVLIIIDDATRSTRTAPSLE